MTMEDDYFGTSDEGPVIPVETELSADPQVFPGDAGMGVKPPPSNPGSHETRYAEWAQRRDKASMTRLVDGFAPTINSEITRYEGSRPLLRSKARVLVVRAVKSYDPSSGVKLNSWVVTNLKQLARYGKKQRDVHIPEVAARQSAIVDRATREFREDYNREPTDEELADELGMTPKRVADVRKMAVPSVASGQFDEIETADGDSSVSPAVVTPSQVPFAQDAVYMSLGSRDQTIFDMLTGSHGRPQVSAKDVAAKIGVSPAYVSARAKEIARQISEVANAY